MIKARKHGWIFVVAALVGLAAGMTKPAAAKEKNSVQNLEKLTAKWLKLRRELNAVRTDWKEKKALLKDQLAMLRRRKKRLQNKIDKKEQKQNRLEERIRKAQSARDRYRDSIKQFEEQVRETGDRLRQLYAKLPAGVKKKAEEKFRQKSPSDGTVGKHLQSILTRYDELSRLDAQVNVSRDIVKMPDGVRREAEVLYLGTGQGFAVLPDRSRAARGKLTETGWNWSWGGVEPVAVRRALAHYRKEKPPGFVVLPLSIRGEK